MDNLDPSKLSDNERALYNRIQALVNLGEAGALASTALAHRLFGDERMRAAWQKAKETGTYPNYPGGEMLVEPEPGELDVIRNGIEAIGKLAETNADGLDSIHDLLNKLTQVLGVSDHNFTFLKKLEAFFGPVLEGANPPLNGAQVATKAYVDDAIARIARTVRQEFAFAVDLATAFVRSGLAKDGDVPEETAWNMVARRLTWSYAREKAREASELARSSQPSRVSSLLYALTGRNGASR